MIYSLTEQRKPPFNRKHQKGCFCLHRPAEAGTFLVMRTRASLPSAPQSNSLAFGCNGLSGLLPKEDPKTFSGSSLPSQPRSSVSGEEGAGEGPKPGSVAEGGGQASLHVMEMRETEPRDHGEPDLAGHSLPDRQARRGHAVQWTRRCLGAGRLQERLG